MKKIFFNCFLLVLVSLLYTCELFVPGEEDVEYTDVVYSPDGRSLTIYLEGSVPVSKSQSRAMNLKLAQLGHDYFEVAFAYKNIGGQITIARAVWETGHPAGVKGVYRPESGIDYSVVRRVDNMPNDTASAVIFVGKKSDKTLLAVGKLSHVDGTAVVAGVPKIDPHTVTVTFTVAALQGGSGYVPAESTFLTSANGSDNAGNYSGRIPSTGNTRIVDALIGRSNFPAFTFPVGTSSGVASQTAARYLIDAYSGNVSVIDQFINGIILADPVTPASQLKTIPRFPLGEGNHEVLGTFELEANTVINMTNNRTSGVPFQNNVTFTFNTLLADDGKINSFYFQIPVSPLALTFDPGLWYIRPGYDSYLYDLDNGSGGTGGAILYGIGNLVNLEYGLKITKQPDKINYRDPTGPTDNYSYLFDAEGLIAYMRAGSWNLRRVDKEDLTFWVGVNTDPPDFSDTTKQIFWDPPTDLRDFFNEPTGSPPGYGSNNMLIITAQYVDPDTGKVYWDRFGIYRSELGGIVIGEVPLDQRYIITSELDIILLYNRIAVLDAGGASNKSIVVISYYSFDFLEVNLNATGFVFIIMAAAPDLAFGVSSTGGFMNHNPNTNAFFFGVWPFNEPVSVDGMAITTYPFTINSTGSYREVTTPGFTGTKNYSGFIRGHTKDTVPGPPPVTTSITVRTGPVTVLDPAYFVYPQDASIWAPNP